MATSSRKLQLQLRNKQKLIAYLPSVNFDIFSETPDKADTYLKQKEMENKFTIKVY